MKLVLICFIRSSFPEIQICIFLPHPFLCSPVNVRGKVPHMHKTTGKIIIVYILILTFLEIGN